MPEKGARLIQLTAAYDGVGTREWALNAPSLPHLISPRIHTEYSQFRSRRVRFEWREGKMGRGKEIQGRSMIWVQR